ncbi:MAG: DEAD/DEAH box helicase [Chloroflexi bacterium]|jgi:superfamily II DNA/RNA helicase/very-short-patch-repair endonuclease|nr:DEAD/DEAH box helicase [Chloroflexota bacterium]
MDVFNLRNALVSEYADYISSFITIRDQRIREYIDKSISEGILWPDPLIQLNPSFMPGHSIDEFVAEGILHPECSKIFRINKGTAKEKTLRLHKHQDEAVRIAARQHNYILTTGTGSGKSLAYIIPIVDHILKQGSGKGIKAIIVYPMNALANSQLGELEKYINLGYPDNIGPVRFARFTGQESDEQRNAIRANPPDILLTNYVMLELLLTRPEDRGSIIRSAKGLQFLVLDELHTYRGRQGADVAMLMRRLRDAVESPSMQCIGTSATLSSGTTFDDQQAAISELASLFFGDRFHPEHIIGETLTRTTVDAPIGSAEFSAILRQQIKPSYEFPKRFEEFVDDPLAIWVESTFGISQELENGRLIRAIPRSITGKQGAAQDLAQITSLPVEDCENLIMDCLSAGYRIINPSTDFPLFAFRLHQFISPGDTVYATLENPIERHISVNYQQFKPGDRSKIMLPVVFCRECGQEYYSVRAFGEDEREFLPREYTNYLRDDESQPAYLYLNTDNPWPRAEDEIMDRLPDDWLEIHRGETRVLKSRKKKLPKYIRIGTDGKESSDGQSVVLMHAPFTFCLECGAAYSSRAKSDYAKLTTLSAGGRSTSTTILSLATIRQLQHEGYLEPKARKLLSFTDNRQDAALQAGHFNDFIETSLIRAALCQAVENCGDTGLRHDQLTQAVASTLDLPIEAYASDPDVRFMAREETDEALRDVLGLRLYRDLRRGWRVMTPNLEQCGLLQIQYLSLEDVCAADDVWENKHPALTTASATTRQKVAQTLLDYMRRELAIQVSYLDRNALERIQQRSQQRLISPWAIDENEKPESAAILYPRSRKASDYGGNVYLSARGGFGLFLNRPGTFDAYNQKLDLVNREQIIRDLLDALRIAGIVEKVDQPATEDDVGGFQLKAAAIIWKASDGSTPFHDPIRMPQLPESGGNANPFFVRFYKSVLDDLKGLRAREHTAQVPYDKRELRENEFRAGKLPIMYCSPTMELGIDISQLNVVNMRNVPPTPANYAQRSGRAGRSGQPALVFTYCAKGSPHDQYFFKRQARMVAGVVQPPRIELANDDLLQAHIHAIWLAETHQKLGQSLKDILELAGDPPSLDLIAEIKDALADASAISRTRQRSAGMISNLEANLSDTDWYSQDWLNKVLIQIPERFQAACERWRDLYRAALKQKQQQERIISDASRPALDRDRARRLRREAESQIELLLDSKNIAQSDFYSYRYFASEGFLPGYNFPRLPLSAYIPARRVRTDEGEYLSRPRFMAISEFGPRSIVYHEGSRYVINRVIMQISDKESDDELLATERVKMCPACGYLHPIITGDGLDLCERCKEPLTNYLSSLYRMQNVSTKRRDRINSDEEERFRLGYEIQTAMRFHHDNGEMQIQQAEIVSADGGIPLAKLAYGDAATIWRINLGWRHRQEQSQPGFVLDLEQGYWKNNTALEDDAEDPMGNRTKRVIPYVEDHKNSLLFEPAEALEVEQMASLTAAIKKAIQVVYQLEDSELAAEALPSGDERRVILFYEAAEGGAGVLRQLIKDPTAFIAIARTALEICHFDPETGIDQQKAQHAEEECEAACYDCLLSYYNQRDHRLLDRKVIRELLMEYRDAIVKTSPGNVVRDDHYQHLRNLCQSELEEKWLSYAQSKHYRLPSKAQHLIGECSTRPDFVYEDDYAVIYVDGYHHLDENRQHRDRDQQNCLENMGYSVIRFGILNDWDAIFIEHGYLFGHGQ